MSQNVCEEAQVPRFYAGRDIFVTGGTGFIGKVLLERLLATCPDIGNIFILIRTKRESNAEARILQLKQSQVFDAIRAHAPHQLDKLRGVAGDVTGTRLGLSDEDFQSIQTVSVVFHVAATLKFEEPLEVAVQLNVLPVMELLRMCDQMTSVEIMIHVSTAYCNAELTHIKEVVYPPPHSVQSLLAVTESLPKDLLQRVTKRYIHPKPNTYTFTKATAEHVVATHPRKRYKIAIFRPSIVICSQRWPFPGWIDNFAGPSGVTAAFGKGLLHAYRVRLDARADLLPADLAAQALLLLPWHINKNRVEDPVPVYNCSSGASPTTWRQYESALRHNFPKFPLDGAIWFPSGVIVENLYLFKIAQFFLQTLPLYIAEYCIRLLGIKTSMNLILVEQRIRSMMSVLAFFTTREWHFETTNMERLRNELSPADAKLYDIDPAKIDWRNHYEKLGLGTRKYLLREDDKNLEGAKKHLRRLKYLHYGFLFVLFALFMKLFLQTNVTRLFTRSTNAVQGLNKT